jgi:hypothetical protein
MLGSNRRAMQRDETNPLGGAAGAMRSGSELARLTPKRVCIRTGAIEQSRPPTPQAPLSCQHVSRSSGGASPVTDGYGAGTEARATPLCKTSDPICIFSGPVRYQPDSTLNDAVVTCADTSQLCG